MISPRVFLDPYKLILNADNSKSCSHLGIVVLTINNSKLEHIIKDLRLPRTYRVGMKLGEATDTR